MLLGYFLNSGQADTLTDTKVSIKTPISEFKQSVSATSDEFKQALNRSIDVRLNMSINQVDMPPSESESLAKIKQWDEAVDDNKLPLKIKILKQTETQSENVIPSSESEPIMGLASHNEIPNGEMMPIDGKQLPTKITAHQASFQTTSKEAIREQTALDSPKDRKLQLNPELKGQPDVSKVSAHVISDKVIEITDPKAVSVAKFDNAKQKLSNDSQTTQPIEVKNTINQNQKEVTLPIDNNISALGRGKIIASSVKQEKNQPLQAVKGRSNDLNLKSIVEDALNQKQNKPVDKVSTNVVSKSAELVAPVIVDKDAVTLPQKNTIKESVNLVAENEPETKLRTALLTGQVKQQSVVDDAASRLNPTTTENSSTVTNKPASVVIHEVNTQTQPHNSISNQAINKSSDSTLSVSVPNKHWNQKFAEHVSMLALKGTSSAQIKLDPPELGPMAVRIHHTGTETQVQFQVSNPIARELVDSGMQRLRDMLEQHGFENVNVDVSEQNDKEQVNSGDVSTDRETDEMNDEISILANPMQDNYQSKSLVDLFA